MSLFSRFGRKNPSSNAPPSTTLAQLRQETAAMPPPVAVSPAVPAAGAPQNNGLSDDALAKMQRMTDIITLCGAPDSATAMRDAMAKRDVAAFVEVALGHASESKLSPGRDGKSWMITELYYDESKKRTVERDVTLSVGQVLDGLQSGFDAGKVGGLDKTLARYTDGKAEPDAAHAKGDLRRMVRASEVIREASGERREWLIATTAKMFDRAATNPHFVTAIEEFKDKDGLKAALSSFGRNPLQAQPGVAGKTLTEDEKTVLSLGLSWRSKTAPVSLQQPNFPQQANPADQALYQVFNYQHSVVSITNGKGDAVTGEAREQIAIRDTLSDYAKQTGKTNDAPFQVATLTRLARLGVTGPKAVYPAAFQDHVASMVTKFAAPVGGGPVAASSAATMKPF